MHIAKQKRPAYCQVIQVLDEQQVVFCLQDRTFAQFAEIR